jgi:tetratricopeptide (TPR) repeat protein
MRVKLVVAAAGAAVAFSASGRVLAQTPPDAPQQKVEQGPTVQAGPSLSDGFRLMYNLRFDEARKEFQAYEEAYPQDPVGPAAEACSYLFQELYEQGVLTSEFFLDDKKLLGGTPLKPDPQRRAGFFDAIARAEKLAAKRLKTLPNDPDALFALTVCNGASSDWRGIIEKKQLEALGEIKTSEQYGQKLLAVDPDRADAYVPIGIGNYIIGCLPGFKRAFLWFGGIHGDRAEGMRQLEEAAAHGSLLRPFAELMVALAAAREKQPELARAELTELTREFPDNPLFARELAKLGPAQHAGSGGASPF